jgi:Putative MetA-pathway of phenol degradation
MRFLPAVGICITALFSSTCIAAEPVSANTPSDGRFSMSLGANYDTGDYGDTINTDVWVIPIGLKYKSGLWGFGISTSWLHVKSPNTVDADGNFLGAGGPSTTEQGIGDVNLSITYNLLDDRNDAFGLELKGKLKIPTADEKKFLGSGKTDYALSAEAYKTFNNWTPYLNVGYKWKGDPEGINYNNVWSTSLGFDYQIDRGLILGAEYFWQQKISRFSESAKEATVYANYYVNDNNKLNFYVLAGSGNSSPNWGSGLTLVHYF